MDIDADHLGKSGGTLADTGHLLERVAHAVGPASPMLGRVAAAVSVVKLASRLIPAGARLVRRYPVGSALVVAGVLGAAYLLRTPAMSARSRPGPRLDSRVS